MPKQTKSSIVSNAAKATATETKKVKKTTKKVVKAPVVEVEVKPEPVVEPEPEPQPEVVNEPVNEEETTLNENEEVVQLHPVEKKTKKLTKEKLQSDWENLFTLYEQELASLKKKPEQKVKMSKYLNSLKNDTFRLLKIRNKNTEKRDTSNSGFNKTVKISEELAKFCNISTEQQVNRVDITRMICSYIKENKLQFEKDKRQIVPDEKLRKLLALTENDENVTYYSIQKLVQPHIFKI